MIAPQNPKQRFGSLTEGLCREGRDALGGWSQISFGSHPDTWASILHTRAARPRIRSANVRPEKKLLTPVQGGFISTWPRNVDLLNIAITNKPRIAPHTGAVHQTFALRATVDTCAARGGRCSAIRARKRRRKTADRHTRPPRWSHLGTRALRASSTQCHESSCSRPIEYEVLAAFKHLSDTQSRKCESCSGCSV